MKTLLPESQATPRSPSKNFPHPCIHGSQQSEGPLSFALPAVSAPARWYSATALLLLAPLLTNPALAQQQPGPQHVNVPASSNNGPQIPDAPPISTYTPNVPTKDTGTPFLEPRRTAPTGLDARHVFGPYRRAMVPPLFPGNGERLQSLVRDGKLYLSAHDAIALAIENNLDVEIERYNLILSDTDYRRAQGGGNLRGIDFTIQEPPNGVGGPGSPLLDSTAQNPNPITPTVTDLTSLNATTQTQTNLSASPTASTQYAAGPQVPLFDPNLFLQAGYLRRSGTVSLNPSAASGSGSTGATGSTGTTPGGPYDFVTTNLSYLQGFRYGTQLEATLNNDSQTAYGTRSQLDPFARPSTSITLTQPLLRGFGASVNLRYLHIANENRKISRLLFEQQVLETVYGASRIYFDLVSLGENVAVKQQALTAAKKLQSDDQAQVEIGTLAPIDLLRADALVSSSQFDLTQAQGLYRTQEVILRNLILRTDSPVFAAAFTEIVPTDRITVPPQLDPTPIADLIQQGLARRPDLAQSELQIRTGQISAAASRNQARPQLNLYLNAEKRGTSEQAYEQLGTPGTAIPSLPQNFALGGLSVSNILQGGLQLNLPLRDRVAQADAARDAVQVRQVQARTEKLSDQIRQDIENAHIALETSFAAYKAAESSRGYQEQLLQADRDRLEFGESTNLQVIQDVAYLAQARASEIAARSNYQKARIELDRNLGDLLDKNGITLEDAVQGQVKP
jgi:outer membrane protein